MYMQCKSLTPKQNFLPPPFFTVLRVPFIEDQVWSNTWTSSSHISTSLWYEVLLLKHMFTIPQNWPKHRVQSFCSYLRSPSPISSLQFLSYFPIFSTYLYIVFHPNCMKTQRLTKIGINPFVWTLNSSQLQKWTQQQPVWSPQHMQLGLWVKFMWFWHNINQTA